MKRKDSIRLMENIRFLLHHIVRYEKLFLWEAGGYVATASLWAFLPITFPKWIIDELFGQQRISRFIWLLGLFFALSSSMGYLSAYFKARVNSRATKVRTNFMLQYGDACMTTDFVNTENPDFLNRSKTAFRAVAASMSGIEGFLNRLVELTRNTAVFIGCLAIACLTSVWLIPMVLIVNVASYFIKNKLIYVQHDLKDQIEDTERHASYWNQVATDFSYGKEIRLFGLADWIKGFLNQYKDIGLRLHTKTEVKNLRVQLACLALYLLRDIAINLYLALRVVRSMLSLASYTMQLSAIMTLSQQINSMLDDWVFLQTESLYLNDYRAFLKSSVPYRDSQRIPIPAAPYTIEFQEVSFRYPDAQENALSGVSFTLRPGEKIAIVGHNGAGKTTIVKLLCRFYEPQEGRICLNGINIALLDLETYREILSAVFQDICVLAFSLAENISLKEKEEIDWDRLTQTVEEVGLSSRVERLPQKYDTAMLKILDEAGTELSVGDKQKLVMARALYKQGKIMIFDEPTAALDAIAEKEIYENLDKLARGKPTIYISHRLSSTQFCDTILFMENGRVVEQGSHADLMAMNGQYCEMFSIQAQYYQA